MPIAERVKTAEGKRKKANGYRYFKETTASLNIISNRIKQLQDPDSFINEKTNHLKSFMIGS